jgi:Tfp pilus assembly protein PilW
MPVRRRDLIRDERGATLVEMVVGISIAGVLMVAMTMVIIVTMHASARSSSQVNATQISRNGLSSIIQQLHSACLSPRIAPVLPESSATRLIFTHSSGADVTAKPVKSELVLAGDTVTQYDYASTGNLTPPWTFSKTATATRQLMAGVAPIPPSAGIFSYYSAANGAVSTTPLQVPLDTVRAGAAVQVSVGFKAAADVKKRRNDVSTHIQDSVLLRLTAPTFNETTSPPCE